VRIAFVNQPRSTIVLPAPGRPLQSGSIGLWLYHVARRCAERHEVRVLCAGTAPGEERDGGVAFQTVDARPGLGPERLARGLAALRRRLPGAPPPGRPPFDAPFQHARYAGAAARALRAWQPDRVCVQNFSQLVPPLRRALPRARIALHMHCDWLVQLDRERLARRLRDCDLVLGCSEHVARGAAERFPALAGRCAAVPNGVDLERFEPGEAPDAGEREPEILFVGRLSPEKGVHVLLEAFARVARRHPRARLTLLGTPRAVPYEYVVGLDRDPLVQDLARFYRGEGDYQAALRARIPAEIAERVAFVPELPQAELVDAYRRAAVFAFPSAWHEPFGLPLVEAMACGTPVVATRGGGIPEIVEDGRSGVLVERGDAAGLAEALDRLLAAPEERRRLAEAGLRRVRERFSWERTAEVLLARLASTTTSSP